MEARVHAAIEFGRYLDPLGNERWVTIPVGVAPAVVERQISFRMMHNCGNPIELKKGTKAKASSPSPIQEIKFCPNCGVEVTEVVRGYEYQKDQFITFTEEELAATKPNTGKTIRIEKFVPRNSVTPLMASDHHLLIPDQLLPDEYGVFYQALAETKLAAFGTQALWRKEHRCVIYAEQGFASGGVLMMTSLHPSEDFNDPDFASPVPKAQEKKVMKEVITGLVGDLSRDDLVSMQRVKLNALVAAKLAGQDLPTWDSESVTEHRDLMSSLRDAIAAKTPKPKRKAAK